MIKKLDSAGRVVIPQSLREKHNIIPEETELKIEDKGNYIKISKIPENTCAICLTRKGEIEYKDQFYCKKCIKELVSQVIDE